MRNIVIFGAGERGIGLKGRLINKPSYKDSLFCFCDNNADLWGTEIEGLKVVSPKELEQFDREITDIYIASGWYTHIFAQVYKMGFDTVFHLDEQDKIIFIEDEEAMLREYASAQDNKATGLRRRRETIQLYKTLLELRYEKEPDLDTIYGFSRHLYDFKGIHKGKRCFVLGNGPSLNQIDISKIKDEITFGSNMVYKAFPQWGFHTTYWMMEDVLNINQTLSEAMDQLPENIVKFLPLACLDCLESTKYPNIVPYNLEIPSLGIRRFSLKPSIIYWGATVTYSMLQIAAIMGCNPIYLIGVDFSHQYDEKSKGKNSGLNLDKGNHFIDNYCNRILTFTAKYEKVLEAYSLAYKETQKCGIKIYNASPNSKLDVFHLANFDSLFIYNEEG